MRFVNKITVIVLLVLSGSCVSDDTVMFTEEEQQWLNENPTITLAVDNTYPPLNYENRTGQIVGLNIDLVKLIEEKLGIDIILEGSPWSTALEKAMNHEVDGIVNATPLEERKHRLVFSESITQDPQALVCDKSQGTSLSFSDFQDKKVASKKNSRQLQLLKTKVPVQNIIEIETLFEGFDLLLRSEIEAIYDDYAPLYYIISSSNISNIKVAFIEDNGGGVTIGLRNNDPIMLSVINKAINSISKEEKARIREKWFHSGVLNNDAYYMIIGFLLLAAIIILIWNRMLNIVVKNKTKQLVEELAERRKIEEELFKSKEKAEESDRLKSAFLANMSHEIRTPMNGIIGFSEMLVDSGLNEELRNKYARIVVDSGQQLLSIVNDILDISRIEAERVEVVKEIVNINQLLDELYDFFKVKTSKKGLDLFTVKGASDSECNIYTDRLKLRQVLNNLLSNAIKFTRSGYVKFGYTIKENQMNFFVEDTGIGINKNIQPKIFERFRQVELDLTRQYGGTGLGLSISEKLLDLLGGKIWVESEPGKGSVFQFHLPYSNLQAAVVKEKTEGQKTGEKNISIIGATILVVDDEEINSLFIGEILKKTGASILYATNGKLAIEMCEEHHEIDIVLMDIKMPVLNGYEATIEIKKMRPEIPVIAQTAYALSGDREKAISAGCDDYISKPVKQQVLLEKLDKYIGSKLIK